MTTATYSPDDNKLRLYSSGRLPEDIYKKAKKHGFIYAPKQGLFVAPMWTPEREDFLIELCGEIEDEDKSLVERQEERAERFEEYSKKRAKDAEMAKDVVDQITSGIPMGQPILIGHHSEKHARKNAERIENSMRRAIKMWDESKYWAARAAGAIRHASYKEMPAVRARRIKGIEADKRKQERTKAEAEKTLKLWQGIEDPIILKKKDGTTASVDEKAKFIANYFDHGFYCFPASEYPRKEGQHVYEGEMSLYSAIDDGIITGIQAATLAIPSKIRVIAWTERWINHYTNRLLYEKAMLEEQGASDLLKPAPRPTQLPLLNYRAPDGIKVENIYHRGEFSVYSQIEMTKAEYAKIYTDNKGTAIVENSHRVRTYFKAASGQYQHFVVFLTDNKVHEKPEPIAKKEIQSPIARTYTSTDKKPERTTFDDMTGKSYQKAVSNKSEQM